jgi:oxygen-independent coproporphyrinogen-3 oxidase
MKYDNEKLFNQIINVHYSTDYSSIDRIYPPFFVWDDNNKKQVLRHFKKFKNKCSEFDLYIHFPYCQEKCAFCRHCSWVPQDESCYDEYLYYLEKEIKKYSEFFNKPPIGHIYFGGGTPTLFRLEKVINLLHRYFTLLPDFQLNIESTFSCLDEDKLKALKKLGLSVWFWECKVLIQMF